MMGLTSDSSEWHAVKADGSPFPGHEHPAMVTLRTGEPQANVVMGELDAALEQTLAAMRIG